MIKRETYYYNKNTPKNSKYITLPVKETFIYGYNYAVYKPQKYDESPNIKVEKKWSGVI